MSVKKIVLVILLAKISLWGLDVFTSELQKVIDTIIIFYLVYEILLREFKHKPSEFLFKKEVLALMFLPFLSSITCYMYRGQSVITTIIVTRGMLLWLFYFYLHKKNVDVDFLLKVSLIIGTIYSLLSLIQQFTYPEYAFFGTYENEETDSVEIRNDLYRFHIPGVTYCFVSLFYCYYRFVNKRNWKFIALASIQLIGIFLSLTRQLWVAALIPFVIYPIFGSNLGKNKKVLLFLIGVGLLYVSYSNMGLLFGGELMEQTNSQIDDEDYVRWQAYEFYGLKYWESPFNVLLGNGMHAEVAGSSYGRFIRGIYDNFGWIHSDIGIVGAFSRYGLLYVLATIALYFKIFKYRDFCPSYILMIVIASLVTIAMIYWTRDPISFSIFLYIIDCSKEKY